MKKVLILGVNGFIGHHLSKRILEKPSADVANMLMGIFSKLSVNVVCFFPCMRN